MARQRKIYLDFIIDRLTNSIENTISGDSFATEVVRLTKADLKQAAKKIDEILIPREFQGLGIMTS